MSEVATVTPITEYMETLEKVFVQDRSKRFLFVCGTLDGRVERIETGAEWLQTDMIEQYKVASIDVLSLNRLVNHRDVGAFININFLNDRNAIVVRIK